MMNKTPVAPGIRPGHFVEGRHYPLSCEAMATARARHLADTYGRAVSVVTRREIAGPGEIARTVAPGASLRGALLQVI